MRKRIVMLLALASAAAVLLQGCGGGSDTKHSVVSGSVSDINRNVVIDATVWADGDETHSAHSLASGAYRLEGIESGWRTIRASAMIKNQTTGKDELWVGSTAAEVLEDEPTMNINVTLARETDTTAIGGVVREDATNDPVAGARVFLTTRLVYPLADTSAYDGPYGSIVAITDENGHYLMEDVPVGLSGIISASKVGFRNDEVNIDTISEGLVQNFSLSESLNQKPDVPYFEAIEAYTMPDTIIRSGDQDAYKTIKAFTSERYRKAAAGKTVLTRSVPAGSLIEIDLYWNALDVNDSRDIAGYGIYRTTSLELDPKAIDFVRDPYANFYGDMGIELTPGTSYFYGISAVSTNFLLPGNVTNPIAEGDMSDFLSTTPLGQLRALAPNQDGSENGQPVFEWSPLSNVDSYSVYLYDRFPSYPLDPGSDNESNPAFGIGLFPIWPTRDDPGGSTTTSTSIQYPSSGVPTLQSGHKYYWVVVASKLYEEYNDGTPKRSAYSYSQIRSFTVR